MVLKELMLTFSTLGGCDGLESIEFLTLSIFVGDVVVLKGTDF